MKGRKTIEKQRQEELVPGNRSGSVLARENVTTQGKVWVSHHRANRHQFERLRRGPLF